MTLSAAEGYISQTPLKVLLREGFTACRVKSSLHLYTLPARWRFQRSESISCAQPAGEEREDGLYG